MMLKKEIDKIEFHDKNTLKLEKEISSVEKDKNFLNENLDLLDMMIKKQQQKVDEKILKQILI